MGKIDYQKIYEINQDDWKALTREPQKYEALLAGHYSDSNHFVYELLQNAEDAQATKVAIEYDKNKLIFYHNGKPFDENDVKGVSSMLMGTKDKNDATTIGKFGMGFKSVFKYTYQPEIYSDDEAFRIENYLLPVEIKNAWNFESEKEKLAYIVNDGEKFYPFIDSMHLTKFIIPFAKKKDDGSIYEIPGNEVLNKLESLTGEILLFLTYIRNLYWVDKITGKFAKITLSEADNDNNLVTCHIETSNYNNKEKVNRYLKYKKVFEHPDMKNAEVSVAYKVNSRANNINEMSNTDIWVYFPTRDNTNLPFLIHGSFETAVSREKLMTPSAFNNSLFDELGNLIAESLEDLKQRKMITQGFIRKVIIGAFKDEENNNTIPGLKEKVTQKFLESDLLLDQNGEYKNVSELFLPVPFGISDFFDNRIFRNSFDEVTGFVAFNNEKETNFTEYFNWLINDLDIKTFTLDKWADVLKGMNQQQILPDEINELNLFYNFLFDNRVSTYSSNYTYTRSGPYERMIKNTISKAWDTLKVSPIILNAEETLVPAYIGTTPNIYLSSSSQYKSVVAASIVNSKVAKEFEKLLDDGFGIAKFDNFQYIKEKIIKKYANPEDENIVFEDYNHFEKEYVEDINQILKHIDETHNAEEIREILKDARIIKIKSNLEEPAFNIPSCVHVDKSDEGIDLNIYYEPIPYEEEREPYDDEEDDEDDDYYWTVYTYDTFEYDTIDTKFYEQYGISIKKLQQLGLITSPVLEGTRSQEGVGDKHWTALGEYCPHINFNGIEDNFAYIEYHPDEELAKQKSAELLKLFLSCAEKLQGKVRYRKNNPYTQEEKSQFLKWNLNRWNWLYSKNGKMVKPSDVSKYDLDLNIYGTINPNKEKYELLGFKETEEDNKADTFEMVEALDERDKKILLKQLARELGMQLEEFDSSNDTYIDKATFNPNTWISNEFPSHKVRNKESLIQHVREQFFCADPVKYQPVLRQIRVSKSQRLVRSYALGMYINESNIQICQMCKEPTRTQFVDVTEIANYGIELPQLHLCLCTNCSRKYKSIRDSKKEEFKNKIKQVIKSADVDNVEDKYEIALNSEVAIYFTQTHLAEIQTFFTLMDEYGLPRNEDEQEVAATIEITDAKQRMFDNATLIPMDSIVADKFRNTVPDPLKVKRMKDIYKNHGKFDIPIHVIKRGNKYILEDKYLRYYVAKQLGHREIYAAIEIDNNYEELTKFELTDVGARISHKAFGKGTVVSCISDRITVKFDSGKESTFDLKLCQREGILHLV